MPHPQYPSGTGGYSASSGPNFRWWIPADGIRRDVIQADIQRYLGPEAVVRPGEGRDNDRGRNGYWIAAYRTLTPAMVQDLKADSANFERSGDRGAYENSMVHRSRQHWGPTGEQQSTGTPVSSRDSEYSRDSRDSRTTASSAGYPAQYQSDGAGSHAYDNTGYGRPDPRMEPQRQQRDYGDAQDSYPGYAPQPQPGYAPRAQSIPEYTHSAPAMHGQPQGGPAYGYPTESDYGRGAPSGYQEAAAPRSQTQYSNPAAASHAGYGASHSGVTSSSHHPTSARTAAPPGYYLASDGKYYPEASRPR